MTAKVPIVITFAFLLTCVNEVNLLKASENFVSDIFAHVFIKTMMTHRAVDIFGRNNTHLLTLFLQQFWHYVNANIVKHSVVTLLIVCFYRPKAVNKDEVFIRIDHCYATQVNYSAGASGVEQVIKQVEVFTRWTLNIVAKTFPASIIVNCYVNQFVIECPKAFHDIK